MVLTTTLMLAGVSIMGTTMLYWATASFTEQKENAANVFQEESDLLREILVVEDVWFDTNATRYVNVTLRNTGNIAINVTKLSLNSTELWNQSVIINSGGDATIYKNYSWVDGIYTIDIETERENILTGVWKAAE